MSVTAPTESAIGQPRPTYARRFGRTYLGLDNLTTASLCSRSLGKVRADCRLRVSKSQWGSLGVRQDPAAIVYMDIAIDQPSNCRLENASIVVTLDETSYSSSPTREPHQSPLQMTDYYGPKHLSGEATKVTVSRSVHLVPQVNVMGSGGGGLGVERERSESYPTRWTFTGALIAGQKMNPFYRTLKWELRENESSARPNRSPVIHTAFALQHSDRPFIMRIEIQGRLQSPKDRFRQRMRHMRFPSPADAGQGKSDTLVYPSAAASRLRPLDNLAMGLSSAMERENLMRVPVEIPDALPVSFTAGPDTALPPPQSDTPLFAQRAPATHVNPVPRILAPPDDAASAFSGIRRRPSLSTSSSSATLVGTPRDMLSSPTREPPSTILETALDAFSGVSQKQSSSNQNTNQLPPLRIPRPKNQVPAADDAALAILTKYPLFLVLLRMMGNLLDLFARTNPSNSKQIMPDHEPDVLKNESVRDNCLG
ncbi:hypothetical protein BJX64DRAFT_280461 [Aspergillus heterothallicus]